MGGEHRTIEAAVRACASGGGSADTGMEGAPLPGAGTLWRAWSWGEWWVNAVNQSAILKLPSAHHHRLRETAVRPVLKRTAVGA